MPFRYSSNTRGHKKYLPCTASDCLEGLLEDIRLGVTLIEFILSITGLDDGTVPVDVNRLKPLIPVGVVGVSPGKKKKKPLGFMDKPP